MPGKILALLPIALFSTEKLTRLSFSNKIYLLVFSKNNFKIIISCVEQMRW
jgi:hypothetical protein